MDSALLHKLMGAMMLQGGDVGLPYVEIDYCKSDGRQYVDLGFQATVINEEIEYVYEPLSDSVNTSIPVGSEQSGATGVFPVVLYSNVEGVYVGTGDRYSELNLTANQFYKITSKTNADNTFTLSVDDEVRVSDSYTGNPNGRNVYAFSSNNGSWTKYEGFFKIKYITRKVAGVLKNNLIAVRMIEDAGGGKIGDIGYWNKVNNTFHGSGSGVPLIAGNDKNKPILDGLVHWWDSEGQSGNAWNPKVGNVPITTSNSWEDGYFKKVRGNTCETPYFDVDFSNGFTVEVLYNLPKFNDIPLNLNYDTQLWVMQNQSNQEYLLHYTRHTANNVYSLYSPVLLGTAYYGTQAPPLNQFFSDVVVYNGSDNIKGYIDGVEILNDTALNNKPTQIKFALSRIYPLNNNLEASVKSIRIYNRALTQEEVEHNREYDKFVLGE